MCSPGISRKSISERLGVGDKQLGRYIKLAAKHFKIFADFIDPKTENLNGTPIETEEQVKRLEAVQLVLRKYKNTKNKSQIIALELEKINKGDNRV